MKVQADVEAVEAHLATFSPQVQEILQALRSCIREEAPQALERMAYGLPTFWQDGNLVHYSAWAHHVGLYPGASGVAAFEAELAPYPRSKGAIRFPLDQPLPLDLVRRIVRYRLEENLARGARRSR